MSNIILSVGIQATEYSVLHTSLTFKLNVLIYFLLNAVGKVINVLMIVCCIILAGYLYNLIHVRSIY